MDVGALQWGWNEVADCLLVSRGGEPLLPLPLVLVKLIVLFGAIVVLTRWWMLRLLAQGAGASFCSSTRAECSYINRFSPLLLLVFLPN